MPLLSFAEYARSRNVSRAAVTQAVQEGRITVVEDPASGRRLIDKDAADKAWSENTQHDRRRNGLGVPSNPPTSEDEGEENKPKLPSIHSSRQIKEAYQARLAKLEYEQKNGALISAEEVKTNAFKLGRLLRDSILTVPDRIAAELAAETDQHKVYNRLREELEKALEELSNGRV